MGIRVLWCAGSKQVKISNDFLLPIDFRYSEVRSEIIHRIHSIFLLGLLSEHLYQQLKTEVVLFPGCQFGKCFRRVTGTLYFRFHLLWMCNQLYTNTCPYPYNPCLLNCPGNIPLSEHWSSDQPDPSMLGRYPTSTPIATPVTAARTRLVNQSGRRP